MEFERPAFHAAGKDSGPHSRATTMAGPHATSSGSATLNIADNTMIHRTDAMYSVFGLFVGLFVVLLRTVVFSCFKFAYHVDFVIIESNCKKYLICDYRYEFRENFDGKLTFTYLKKFTYCKN